MAFFGHYPRQVLRDIKPTDFFPNHIKTHVERDVRLETGVRKIDRFMSFIWDSSAHEKEVDLIIEDSGSLALYEIKAAQTAKAKHADNLILFERNAAGVKCSKRLFMMGCTM